MQWRKYILLAVPFLLSAIFILFAVPVQYRFLSFIPVFLFWIVYYILLYREKKKKR
ncbi:hypothetical protein ACPOM7_15880 [Peribacillus castrilensis]|uniref:Uncharacterized protein n=4 Tax=Bacillaceae TaxID=186817 RepID=A0AAJ1QKD4_9BACI|nr:MULTISPECIES: hypothetical protein [Bacillaceae]MBL3642820.1 hypothetical protein [Bacillus sp. RHFB]MCP1095821.1 hypothetical protein [Bacillaceae bacterium OS4b]MDP9742499.1 Ca2+/Na+ antiporter [Bacillus sp. B2I3]MEC0273693.1 hypothetical protein [Peribacillus castrilensis]QYF81984.1 hypothetical protein KY492_24080 [Brevibacterium sp. PAMC21349]